MDQKRVLIVESDNGFALSIAAVLQEAGFASTLALSAADAQRELRERRPDLIILRAELPDLSGFSLCSRLRKDKTAHAIPIILMSSDATAEALAQHRSHAQSAADGYLQMPFPMEEMLQQAQGLLSLLGSGNVQLVPGATVEAGRDSTQPYNIANRAGPATPTESSDDLEASLDGAFGVDGNAPSAHAVEGGAQTTASADPSAAIAGIEAMVPPPPPRPPRLPKRPRRSSLSDEDRQFLDRVFESIADRKAELLAESRNSTRRAPVKRELLATPEGKLQILREELNRREAQVARLSEIWGIRERELTSSDDKLHEKEVEIQGLKMQVDDLMRRLSDARDLFIKKDQEHGAALDSMLLEKFVNEKELIEVVAAKEKDVSLLRRDLHAREDDVVRRNNELEQSREEILRLEKARQDEFDQYATHLHELEGKLSRREVEILGWGTDFDEAVRVAQLLSLELNQLKGTQDVDRRQAAAELMAAQKERDFSVHGLERQLEGERARAAMGAVEFEEARGILEHDGSALREDLQVAEEQLAETLSERDALKLQRDGVHQSLSNRWHDSETEVARLKQELTQEHDQGVARAEQLSSELAQRVEQIGNLEGELEALRTEKEERESELLGDLGQATERLEGANGEIAVLTKELESTKGRADQLAQELDSLRLRTDEERQAAEANAAALTRQVEQLTQGQTDLNERLAQLQQQVERTSQELAQKIELAGSLDGELSATRAQAKEREAELEQELSGLQSNLEKLGAEKARVEGEMSAQIQAFTERVAERDQDLVGMQQQRAELKRQLEEAGQQLEGLRGDLESLSQQKSRFEAETAAKIGELEGGLADAQAQIAAGNEEQQRLISEAEDYKARAEARAAELRGELAAAEQARSEADEQHQGAIDELTGQRDQLTAEVAEKAKVVAELERKHLALQAEKTKREEALTREAQVRMDQAKTAEKRLQNQLADADGQLKTTHAQLQEVQAAEKKVAEELAQTQRKVQEAVQRADKSEKEREGSRREAQGLIQARDQRIAELTAQGQTLAADKRKVEEEAVQKLQRTEARAKDLEAKLETAAQARDRVEREGQAGLQQRAKKIQELELAIEAANTAKGRLEKDLGARAQQAEAKAQDVTQKLASALRAQKEIETKLQKDGADQAAKLKAELERREGQRQQEVARLQQALQEKSKQVKVLELELQRIKQRGPGASPTSTMPRASPATSAPAAARRPAAPPPTAPEEELEVSMGEESTQVMSIPPMPGAKPAKKPDDADEDLDDMLNKLEI